MAKKMTNHKPKVITCFWCNLDTKEAFYICLYNRLTGEKKYFCQKHGHTLMDIISYEKKLLNTKSHSLIKQKKNNKREQNKNGK